MNSWKKYLKKGGIQLSMDIDKRLCVTVPEAAKLVGISRNHCYELVKQGIIPSIRLGNRIVIPKIALDKKLAEAK